MMYSNTDFQINIPDVQGSADARQIPIQKVGVTNLRTPLKFQDSTGAVQTSVAMITMCVDLAAEQKGAHISRFVEVLGSAGFVLNAGSLHDLLVGMVKRLEADAGFVEIQFPYFVEKSAPVTGVKSLLDYEVTISGTITTEVSELMLKVAVPVTSLCPCSKKISRKGAHNQRSLATVEVKTSGAFWIEDVIDLVEAQASCELYSLLKRADEKYVTEKAYANPKFVEDMVRDVAACLAADKRVSIYTVECENFESIHNHSAYAQISSGKDQLDIAGNSAGAETRV